MESNNLFNPSQHGFRLGCSCLSQLLCHYEKNLQLLENGHDVDILYLDFAYAFHKVDFNILLNKLHYMGITMEAAPFFHYWQNSVSHGKWPAF